MTHYIDTTQTIDLTAESCVLGSMLLSRTACDEVTDTGIQGRDFGSPRNEIIFDAICAIAASGQALDVVLLQQWLTQRGGLTKISPAYLHEMIQSVPTVANAAYYAQIVVEKAVLRRLADAGRRITALGEGGVPGSALELYEQSRAIIDDVAVSRLTTMPDATAVFDAIADLDVVTKFNTPWNDLTEILSGWHPGRVYFVAGRPATGKSMVGMILALHAAANGAWAHIATLEMSSTEYYYRLLSNVARVDHSLLMHRRLTQADRTKLDDAARIISQLPLTVDDRTNQTVGSIRSAIRERARSGLGIVVIDYIGLMGSGAGRKGNRQEEVAEMSRALKLMARELKVPVVVLAQLNRGPMDRSGNRPMMSDLRDSGAQEQDADAVLLLHRDENRRDDLEMIVAKNRHGPSTALNLRWHPTYCVVEDWQAKEVAGQWR